MSLPTLINQLIESYLKGSVYTAIPAEVLDVTDYTSNQMISVKPTVSRLYNDGISQESPDIHEVPVVMPSAGNGLLSFPIKVGDTVLLVFSMRDTSNWKHGDGKLQDPSDFRSYHITDAIAIPGLYTSNTNLSPNARDTELKFTSTTGKHFSLRMEEGGDFLIEKSVDDSISQTVYMKDDGSVGGENENGSVDISQDGTITLTFSGNTVTFNTDGSVVHSNGANITSGGDFVTASGISLDNHTHDVPVTGGSSAGTYTSQSPN